jgi:glycosyltransferase involved in cell wall biosynthesis
VARLFAWCDSPDAPTGFGRSAKHVLYALHEAGHEIVQLAVNHEPAAKSGIPWELHVPTDRKRDPYGLRDIQVILGTRRFEALWATFDPEVPFKYQTPDGKSALELLVSLKQSNPGFKMLGWFPVDGGPLSDLELGQLGLAPTFDVAATMATHVYDLIEWTMKLRGRGKVDREALAKRLMVLPHGVELDRYKIPTPEEKAAAKRRMGIDPDTFVILQLERNQQRKQNWLALEALENLFAQRPELRGKVLLYQHMLQDEENHSSGLGFNLPELAWRFGLRVGTDIKWPGGFVSEEALTTVVYPAADAFLSVSTGEGFQYPAWEALACGIPLVVPNADARAAWFTHVPNVHLYDAGRNLVMRGGYARRMHLPDPKAAASVLRKIIEGKQSYVATPERQQAGRNFVERTADHRVIAQRWVELMEHQLEVLATERGNAGIVDRFTAPAGADYEVAKVDNWGIGDLVLATPAFRTCSGLVLEIPTYQHDLARALMPGVRFLVEPVQVGETVDLSRLWNERDPEWFDPSVNRSERIARELGVPVVALQPAVLVIPEAVRKRAAAQFLERFGVSPDQCVGIHFESGSPKRSLPQQWIEPLAQQLRRAGKTPVVFGTRPHGIRTVGTIDLSGQTDLGGLAVFLGLVGSFIGVDAGPLYLALAQGTPSVGAFTNVDPDARMRWVGTGPRAAVTPQPTHTQSGKSFPAGEEDSGDWAQYLAPDRLFAAWENLTGTARNAPKLIIPGGA